MRQDDPSREQDPADDDGYYYLVRAQSPCGTGTYGDSKLLTVLRCSDTTTQACQVDAECPAGETCGLPGRCSVTTATPCKFDSTCPFGEECILDVRTGLEDAGTLLPDPNPCM